MQNLYHFPPWRKQFYFSSRLLDDKIEIPLIYQPYIASSKLIWYLWKKVGLFRKCFKIKAFDLPHTFLQVSSILQLDSNTLYQINTGTAGPEQKMTILAHDSVNGELFIKAGTTSIARELIANEIHCLLTLNGRLGTALVVDSFSDDSISILATELIHGNKFSRVNLDEYIFNYILRVSQFNKPVYRGGLLYTFTHGDCCPWNFIEKENNEIVLIDWELSTLHPIGYDLFTFIFQTSFLLTPKKDIQLLIDENEKWIELYFSHMEIRNYEAYLKIFVELKVEAEFRKGNTPILKLWNSLNNYLNKAK